MQQVNDSDGIGPKKKGPSFFKLAQQLPAPLFRRFMKQFGASLGIAILTVVLVFYTKQAQYCWGLLFSLYLAYLALSLVWNYYGSKISCAEMVCVKATRLSQQRMYLILREYSADPLAQNVMHQFYIPASQKDLAMITPNTIMTVYYDPRSPLELIAWEITGNL